MFICTLILVGTLVDVMHSLTLYHSFTHYNLIPPHRYPQPFDVRI